MGNAVNLPWQMHLDVYIQDWGNQNVSVLPDCSSWSSHAVQPRRAYCVAQKNLDKDWKPVFLC